MRCTYDAVVCIASLIYWFAFRYYPDRTLRLLAWANLANSFYLAINVLGAMEAGRGF